MTNSAFTGAAALRSALFSGVAATILIGASPAFAQTRLPNQPAEEPTTDANQDGAINNQDAVAAPADGGPDAPETTPATGQEVVVTGSRIRRPNAESVVPITSIAGETLFQQGDTNIGDTLSELPQLRTTYGQQNPGLGIGIAGLNLLDLRGLGTLRTLVLVNGRRHVAADILNNAVSPDINSIPNDLIERVDIVTGGNSAVYGSDAIAGVVNFVLRRNFNGLQIRGQAGVSPEGFGGNQYVSGMFGKNFGGDRGNVTLHAEFANQDRVFGSELPWLRTVNQFVVVDSDPSGLPNGSDGFPDSIILRDVRSAAINRFGLVPITQPGGAGALCGTGTGQTNGPTSSIGATPAVNGVPYNCTFLFQPGGTFVAQTGTRTGAGIIGGIIGGNGQTGREGQLLSIQPAVKRYNLNLLAHFTISDAFEPFIEAKWNRVDAVGNNASPAGIQGTFGQFDFRERARLDNPFLTAAQRTQIANAILTSGCNTSLTVACVTPQGAAAARGTTAGQGTGGPLNAADIAAINAGTYRFVIARSFEDVGIRDEYFRRDTVRVVGGVRGRFNDDWNYEASVNYGRFDQTVDTRGYIDRQRLLLALDAGVNPVTGQIQCRSQFDPAAAVGFDRGAFQTGSASRGNAGQAARLAADIAACVPYNPFGQNNNAASVAYFSRSVHTDAYLEQMVANAFVSGDSSQLFELPGGPIRFALGAEYREEDGEYIDDPFVTEGSASAGTQTNTNAVTIGNFVPPAFKVKEAFGEIQVPLLKELPFFHELSVSAAGRVAKYNGATGTVYAWNAGGEYAPIRDLRLRANYSRAVRAPNLSELFFPSVANFAPGFIDPCSPNQLASNPNRPANCLAQVGGNAAILAGIPNVTQSLPVISGSNPNLTEETSKSLTLGAVIAPRFIPGLVASVDYYKIKVEDVIVSLTAQQIANNCVDQPTTANVFCGLFQRYLGSGPGPLGEVTGQVLGNTLIQAGVNFAARRREGIDFNLAYARRLSSDFRVSTNFILTHNLKISNFENPALPNFENRILKELGDPQDEYRFDLDLGFRNLTFGYRQRYIGKMFTTAYENFRALPTACTPAGCPPLNLDSTEPNMFPEVFYHDLRLQADLQNRFQFYAGVDNVLNTLPPFGVTGTGQLANDRGGRGESAIYDAFGRKFYAGFKARF